MCKIRNSPHMEPSPLNRFIVVERSLWDVPEGFRFTKDHSCYLRYTARVMGVAIDYRKREDAESAAARCNGKTPEGNFMVVEVTTRKVNRVCFDVTFTEKNERKTLWQEIPGHQEKDVEGYTQVCVNLLKQWYEVHSTWVEWGVEVDLDKETDAI